MGFVPAPLRVDRTAGSHRDDSAILIGLLLPAVRKEVRERGPG